MTKTDDTKLINNLRYASRLFKRCFHVYEEKSGMNSKLIQPGYAAILHTLVHKGEMSQKQIAQELEIRPQSLTGSLDKLEESGYIQRKRSEDDHRAQLVSVTEEGRKIEKEMNSLRSKAATEYFQCLSEEEKQQLFTLLSKLNDSNSST